MRLRDHLIFQTINIILKRSFSYYMISGTCINFQKESFFYLLEKLNQQDEVLIQKYYAKNFQLMKADINVSNECPNLLQISDLYIKVFNSHK